MTPLCFCPRRLIDVFSITVLVLATAGCAVPGSKHPLSDEKTSVIDERLVGYWELFDEEDPKAPGIRVVVGQVKGKKNTLEAVWVDLNEGHVEVQRAPMYCKQVGMQSYISQGGEKEDPTYEIIFYKFAGDDDKKLKIYRLNEDAIISDIEAGRLKGIARKKKQDPSPDPNKATVPEYEEVLITASPKELADYLKEHSPNCFGDKPMTFLRLSD